MATFTTIADTVLEPGKPIRSVDTLALRDNPIAIAGGAAGAPRVVTNAIQDANVTTAKLATNERMITANVLSATAGASAGAVGTYALLGIEALNTSTGVGGTRGGSELRFLGFSASANNRRWSNSAVETLEKNGAHTVVPAGTWRCMGEARSANFSPGGASVWLRIS